MKILHYALGFPPYRSGGMTTYCMSLIEEQKKQGHDVSMMWDGSYSLISSKTKIAETNHTVNGIEIKSYEIKNGLPVPLLDGIRDTEAFQKVIDKTVFDRLFAEKDFDVLHVHTLMGLPIECIESANEHGIKTVFTTHDSFGICCKQGLFVNGHICNDHKCLHCYDCNDTALSLKKISVLQSALYRNLKDLFLVKLLRKRHNNQLFTIGDKKELNEDKEHATGYITLREYYIKLLNAFKLIHYNSTLMKHVYENFGVKNENKVFLVSHKNIKPSFLEKKEVHNPVNIGYLGPINVHKGYYFLKDVLDEVYKTNQNFKLHVYNEFNNDIPYMVNHEPYKYDGLAEIMGYIDLVVVPSQYYETFGFNTLEALSYGVPVIVTENVGAKDFVVEEKNGFVESSTNDWIDKIKELLERPEKLFVMNRWIIENQKIYSFNEYVNKLEEMYK